jgi:hypothetical protein
MSIQKTAPVAPGRALATLTMPNPMIAAMRACGQAGGVDEGRRRALWLIGAGGAAAVVAGGTVAAMPAPHPDAKLLQLERQYEAAEAVWSRAQSKREALEWQAWDLYPRAPCDLTYGSSRMGQAMLRPREEIARCCSHYPATMRSGQLLAIFDELMQKRNEIDERLGIAAAVKAEDSASDLREEILDEINATRAEGAAGLLVKLNLMMEEIPSRALPDDLDFGERLLVSLVADAERLAETS